MNGNDILELVELNAEKILTDYIKDIRDNNCIPSVTGDRDYVTGLKVEEYIKKIEKGEIAIPESYELEWVDKNCEPTFEDNFEDYAEYVEAKEYSQAENYATENRK